jgi:hypothetical protein
MSVPDKVLWVAVLQARDQGLAHKDHLLSHFVRATHVGWCQMCKAVDLCSRLRVPDRHNDCLHAANKGNMQHTQPQANNGGEASAAGNTRRCCSSLQGKVVPHLITLPVAQLSNDSRLLQQDDLVMSSGLE